MENSDLSENATYPIFLDKFHHLTKLIIEDCHKRVGHGGVKATLTELQTRYWIVQGRQKLRMIVYHSVICRRFQSKPFSTPPPPPLPVFRVSEGRPFAYTGVDFAGPIHIKPNTVSPFSKAWICLFTCCATRAVHLELVPDMTILTFIRCFFKRFTSRRGFPLRIISDNAKTFKAVFHNCKHQVVVQFGMSSLVGGGGGGIFEHMIQTAKRCLRRTAGKARLTYDEFLTAVYEVEMILNSRPISYVSKILRSR